MFSMSQPKEVGVAENANDGVKKHCTCQTFSEDKNTSTCQRLVVFFEGFKLLGPNHHAVSRTKTRLDRSFFKSPQQRFGIS